MYSLDINLLRERAEYQTGSPSEFINNTAISPPKYGKAPLFIGMGVAALTLLASGGGWFFLGQRTTQLEAKQKDLDRKLGSLQAQDRRLQDLTNQAAQVSEETQSLASVFNQIQPWSAILQDLRESIPQGVQIANVTQSEIKGVTPAPAAPGAVAPSGGLINKVATPPSGEAALKPPIAAQIETKVAATVAADRTGTPATTPSPTATLSADIPTTKVDITGTAKSFDEVNNFILTLKQSAFFNPDDTQLLSAGLIASGTLTRITPKGTIEGSQNGLTQLQLPKVVKYKIQTSLKRIPAADLIRELERKGAVGLVTRLKSLQQQQVIKP
jgi:type IV pilus assembly protein PilN